MADDRENPEDGNIQDPDDPKPTSDPQPLADDEGGIPTGTGGDPPPPVPPGGGG